MSTRLQRNSIMICIKSINMLSNGKWTLTQTQVSKPKRLFLGEKLKKRLNNSTVSQSPCQKHLTIFFDPQLTFEEHLNVIPTNVNKTTGLIRKFPNVLPRPALMTISKPCARPHLGYGDLIYDEACNETFHQQLEPI